MNNEEILTIKNGILIKCDRNVTGNIVIPEGVTYIGDWAFCGCSGLTSVAIPNSVTIIGDCAFDSCSSLTSVSIPNTVTIIGDCAFRGCSGLTSVAIPNSVTAIREYTFYKCSGLMSVTIPNSVTYIGAYAFCDCKKLLDKLSEQGVFYKAFNPDMTCRGYQYNFGTNLFDGEPIMCEQGFHYCDNPLSIFDYYCGVDGEDIIICKVKPLGNIIQGNEHKHVCNTMEIIERVTFNDIFELYIRSK